MIRMRKMFDVDEKTRRNIKCVGFFMVLITKQFFWLLIELVDFFMIVYFARIFDGIYEMLNIFYNKNQHKINELFLEGS